MDLPTRRLIEAIHRAPFRCVLAVTGGGARAIAQLLSVPGGSRTVLEAVVPYHEQALVEYLGRRPDQSCSAATSRDMAARAYERASWLAPAEPVAGVGCTASLATDRPKKGDHRFHLSVQTAERTTTFSLTLTKDARDREAEEMVLDVVLLNALAAAFGIGEGVEPPFLPGETVHSELLPRGDPLSVFLRGELPFLCAEVDGQLRPGASPPGLLLAGAYNPVHEGHWGMAESATRMNGLPVAFELSVTNVDKPPLALEDVRHRLRQFAWRAPVWLTRSPTFAEKAVLFPGAVFVVGADTAARIVAPRYYEDEGHMNRALQQVRDQGCRFLVAGRTDPQGIFRQMADLAIPAAVRDLFEDIPETAFRSDLSSTQLRSGTKSGS